MAPLHATPPRSAPLRRPPPAYVKPFVRRQKNDRADAESIAETALRPTIYHPAGDACIALGFKLMMSAQGKWQKRNGPHRMPEIFQGIAYVDGIKQTQNTD